MCVCLYAYACAFCVCGSAGQAIVCDCNQCGRNVPDDPQYSLRSGLWTCKAQAVRETHRNQLIPSGLDFEGQCGSAGGPCRACGPRTLLPPVQWSCVRPALSTVWQTRNSDHSHRQFAAADEGDVFFFPFGARVKDSGTPGGVFAGQLALKYCSYEYMYMQMMDIDNVARFPFPTPPDPEALTEAVRTLYTLGCLTNRFVNQRQRNVFFFLSSF